MLTSHKELLENYNPKVPSNLKVPEQHGKFHSIQGKNVQMTLTFDGESVTKINFVVDDDKIDSDSEFYKMFVEGLEQGMGWSSANFYHAMMATLEDHGVHEGTNELGITARHVWGKNKVIIVLTKEGETGIASQDNVSHETVEFEDLL